jgi:GxxExxY protein
VREFEISSNHRDTKNTEVAQREEKKKEKLMDPHLNELTHEIIGSAIEVHRHLGPGLLESAYRLSLCRELFLRGIKFKQEDWLPFEYKGLRLPEVYRMDILVEDSVVVEVKAVEALAPIHEAQLLTYLQIGGWRIGLLFNFNVVVLKQGIRRRTMGFDN